MTDIAPSRFDSWACDHGDTAVRIRTRSNRVEVYVLQCLTCGAELRALGKQSKDVLQLPERIPFDEDLGKHWQDDVMAAQVAFYGEQQRAARALQEARQGEWWDTYTAYLLTPEWRARRQLVLDRANGWCEGCAARPAVQVHHLNYKHVGHEFLFELVAVCMPCHERLHAREEAA